MKNYYKEIAKMLDLKLGEEFETRNEKLYNLMFTEDDFKCRYKNETNWMSTSTYFLEGVFSGADEIIKKPFKPKNGDKYHICGFDLVYEKTWIDDVVDYKNYYCGNYFRTEEEALKHRDELVNKLKEHYENS